MYHSLLHKLMLYKYRHNILRQLQLILTFSVTVLMSQGMQPKNIGKPIISDANINNIRQNSNYIFFFTFLDIEFDTSDIDALNNISGHKINNIVCNGQKTDFFLGLLSAKELQ